MLSLSSDLETICNVVRDVVPNLEENGARVNGDELDLRMMVHQSQAGCVIGKGGYKIKELRDKCGARIKIFSNCAPQSTDRIIQIVGQPDKCIDSIREIVTLIKTNPIRGPVNPYDPHNYDEYYAEEYGGYGGRGQNDRRGGMDRRGGGRMDRGGGGRFGGGNRGPRGPPMGGGMGGPRGGFGGPPRGGGYNRNDGWGPMNGGGGGMMNNAPSSMMGNGPMGGGPGPMGGGMGGGPGPMGGGMGGGPMGGGNMGGGSGNSMGGGGGGGNGPNKTSTQVTIPKDLAGAIIGKGGGRIRKIRADSGAGITIDEPLPGSNDRIITITGAPNQIQMAQYLLQQSVHENNGRGGGGGGGGNKY
ncbi:heterogeneous nuclear ribonucleoprotein K isoform X2 [Chrysoperla carnea]|nr:heterogeneous nuclear ribonucleoprotein K isoform X2 [Chrysoperla carnea]